MSYRNITVDGIKYQYTVGKTHVKIKGLGVWPKGEIGELFANLCECCGDPLDTIYSSEKLSDHDYTRRVNPKHVARKIGELIS